MVRSKHIRTSVLCSSGRSVSSVCINTSWQRLPHGTPKDAERDEQRDGLGQDTDKEKDGQTELQ